MPDDHGEPAIEPGQEAETARQALTAAIDADTIGAIDYDQLRRHIATAYGLPLKALADVGDLRTRVTLGLRAAAHLLDCDRDHGTPLVAFEVGHGQVMGRRGVGFGVFLTVTTAHGLEVTADVEDSADVREMARALLLNAIELDAHNAGATQCHAPDAPAPPVLADEDRDLAVAWLRNRATLLDVEALVDDEHRGEGCARAAELRAVADLIGTNAHRTPLR